MTYLLFIIIGGLIGTILKRRIPALHRLPTLMLGLLLVTILFMGMEVDPRALSMGLFVRALSLSIAAIIGSMLCLSFTLFLIRRHAERTHRQ